MPEEIQKPAVCVKAFKGAPHGHTTFQYNPGDQVPAELAAGQVSLGNAKFVDGDVAAAGAEIKAAHEAENAKAAAAADEEAAKVAEDNTIKAPENANAGDAPENKEPATGRGKKRRG